MIAAGTTLGDRYEVTGPLARGGMADVFRAYDRRLRRPVAVKVLRGSDPAHRGRFDTEMRVLARLGHPHLVKLFDGGEHLGDPYLVLELIEGETLAERLRRGPLDQQTVLAIGRDLAAALAYLGDHGIVHRDVKPSNVMFDRDGRVLLTDFGVVRLIDTTRVTATAMTVGTAAYMAPEQVTGAEVAAAADVYALGLVLLECFSGVAAFQGRPHEAAAARLVRSPDLPGDLDPGLRELLVEMTQREPGLRPPSLEVSQRLQALLTPEATEVLPVRTAPVEVVPTETPSRRRWTAVATAAVLAAALGGTIAASAVVGGSGNDNPGREVPVTTEAQTTSLASATSKSSTTTATSSTTSTSTTSRPTTTTTTTTTSTVCTELQSELTSVDEQLQALGGSNSRRARDLRRQLEDRRSELESELDAASC